MFVNDSFRESHPFFNKSLINLYVQQKQNAYIPREA